MDKNKLSRDYEEFPLQKGEAINKQDLKYLWCDCNYNSKEIGKILGCQNYKVTHFCRKYNLHKTKEQIKQLNSAASKKAWQNYTEEEKQLANAKRKAYWNNKSPQEQALWREKVSKNSTKMWKNRSEEQLQITKAKISKGVKQFYDQIDPSFKQEVIKKFKKSWYDAPMEIQQERNFKNSQAKIKYWQNITPEEFNKRSEAYKNTMQNKSPEELQDIQNKIYQTKKKNSSFNISNDEEIIYNKLCNKFVVVERQYKTKEYPFACDFYIPELNLYIDYNGTWTHGGQAFDENNDKHKQKLEKWKNNTSYSNFYKNAIYTWTDLDVRKREIAIKNNINRIVFYNMQQFDCWLEEHYGS